LEEDESVSLASSKPPGFL
jgi:hypothetical protein